MQSTHWLLRTWTRAVTLYFTPSHFARAKLAEAGLPADRILVKPNFVHPDPGVGSGDGGYVLFVGRLSPEKGIGPLLDAWARVRQPLRLTIVGDGPLDPDVRRAAARDPRIQVLGRRSSDEVLRLAGRAMCLVVPSLFYETFGRVVVEGFAAGTPAVVSRLGALEELVEDGVTGLVVRAGDAADLAARIDDLASDAGRLARMRAAARAAYVQRYTADSNYGTLMAIYGHALALARPSAESPAEAR
jgi:glycosyltransferase involved in cell wall biosynthesis